MSLNTLSSIVSYVTSLAEDAEGLTSKLNEYRDLLANELTKKGKVPILKPPSRCIIIGDIHGDLTTLSKILTRITLHTLKSGDALVVFLGDYIDRGPHQLETLLAVLELKFRYPDIVYALRGNHEPPRYLIPSPHDFPEELIMRFGYSKGIQLYDLFMEIFDVLPHALVIEREILLLHGGLPTITYKRASSIHEYLIGKSAAEQNLILTEVLWNDPIDHNIVSLPSPRGAGYLFGTKVTYWALHKFNLRVIVRGHEPANMGYKLNHNKKVITLFSRVGAPYYNASAAYMDLDLTSDRWWEEPEKFIITLSDES